MSAPDIALEQSRPACAHSTQEASSQVPQDRAPLPRGASMQRLLRSAKSMGNLADRFIRTLDAGPPHAERKEEDDPFARSRELAALVDDPLALAERKYSGDSQVRRICFRTQMLLMSGGSRRKMEEFLLTPPKPSLRGTVPPPPDRPAGQGGRKPRDPYELELQSIDAMSDVSTPSLAPATTDGVREGSISPAGDESALPSETPHAADRASDPDAEDRHSRSARIAQASTTLASLELVRATGHAAALRRARRRQAIHEGDQAPKVS